MTTRRRPSPNRSLSTKGLRKRQLRALLRKWRGDYEPSVDEFDREFRGPLIEVTAVPTVHAVNRSMRGVQDALHAEDCRAESDVELLGNLNISELCRDGLRGATDLDLFAVENLEEAFGDQTRSTYNVFDQRRDVVNGVDERLVSPQPGRAVRNPVGSVGSQRLLDAAREGHALSNLNLLERQLRSADDEVCQRPDEAIS